MKGSKYCPIMQLSNIEKILEKPKCIKKIVFLSQ